MGFCKPYMTRGEISEYDVVEEMQGYNKARGFRTA